MPRHRSKRRSRALSHQPLMHAYPQLQSFSAGLYPQPAVFPHYDPMPYFNLNWYMAGLAQWTVAQPQPPAALVPVATSTSSYSTPALASTAPSAPILPATDDPLLVEESPSLPVSAGTADAGTLPVVVSTAPSAPSLPASDNSLLVEVHSASPAPAMTASIRGPPPAVPIFPRRSPPSSFSDEVILISDEEDELEFSEEEEEEPFKIMNATLDEDYCTICCEDYKEYESFIGILHNCLCHRWCYVCAEQCMEMGLKCPRCRKNISHVSSQVFKFELLKPKPIHTGQEGNGTSID